MSFILDALKKSEQERARNAAPAILELPRGKQRRVTPLWMVVVLLLLLVNCGLLVFMMMRKSEKPAAANTAMVTTPAPAPATVAPAPLRKPMRSLEEEAGVAAPVAEEDATDVEPTPPHTAAQTVATNNATPRMVTAEPTRGSVTTLEALGGHTAMGLPELKLDLHVFAPNARERLVFINSKRYREGEVLAEGPTVDSITAQGVVLMYRGQSFLLPR